jgi:hypothetical protein
MNVLRMEDVARRAGMTTGAIYGNFKNRDELFIAMSETDWPQQAGVNSGLEVRWNDARARRSNNCCNSRTTAVVRTFGGCIARHVLQMSELRTWELRRLCSTG